MKFVECTEMDMLRGICIKYDLCTGMDCEEYSKLLKSFDCKKRNVKGIIEKAVDTILASSYTEITREELASIVYNRCISRWVE